MNNEDFNNAVKLGRELSIAGHTAREIALTLALRFRCRFSYTKSEVFASGFYVTRSGLPAS